MAVQLSAGLSWHAPTLKWCQCRKSLGGGVTVHPSRCVPGQEIVRSSDEKRPLAALFLRPLVGNLVSDRTVEASQPLIQGRVHFGGAVVPDCARERLFLFDEHDELFAADQPGGGRFPLGE